LNHASEAASPRATHPDGLSLRDYPLDRQEIAPSILNIETKERSNLLPWKGQFSPQLVEAVLRRFAHNGASILDPFCGSGTVLHEAGRLGMSATGFEINPAAFVLSRTYHQINRTKEQRETTLSNVGLVLERELLPRNGLFGTGTGAPSAGVKQKLVNIVSGSSGDVRELLETIIVLADFFHDIDEKKAHKIWNRVQSLVRGLPESAEPIGVHHQDCRTACNSPDVDLVLTSPPYINVYNYHQQYRASTQALGWNLLGVARSEIGSNRKHRANRFLTVIQYCLDIAECISVVAGATKDSAMLIFVVGRESNVRGIPFYNSEIVARLAVEAVGLNISLRQERVFTNRFGQRIYEDILYFEKRKVIQRTTGAAARNVARSVLKCAFQVSNDATVISDLEEALHRAGDISSSPIFKSDQHWQLPGATK
jgi:16S rRNA G966 N2-methylase RsmD